MRRKCEGVGERKKERINEVKSKQKIKAKKKITENKRKEKKYK